MSKMREALQFVIDYREMGIDEFSQKYPDYKIGGAYAFRDYITRLARAALASEEENGWRPIETAPKDGTDFLALVPFRRKHHQMVGCFAPNGKFVSWPGRWDYEPTHWRPLPSPPAVPDKKP